MIFRVIRQMPLGALAYVPMLMLPILLGAFYLVAFPGFIGGAAFVVIGTVCLAWYFLGGALALGALSDAIRRRREVSAMQTELAEAKTPALLLDPTGLVLAQNDLALATLGDWVGRYVQAMMLPSLIEPDRLWAGVLKRLSVGGGTTVEVDEKTRFDVRRKPGGSVQFWRAPPDETTFEQMADTSGQAIQFDSLPVALLLLDNAAQVLCANTIATEILGQDVTGLSLDRLFDGPGQSLKEWVADVCEGRLSGADEVLRLRVEGPERFLQVKLSQSSAGQVIAILSDASVLKRLEAQFVQSQKMQAIGQLAGGIAHDFNNVLTAISGHCDLLMLRHDKGDPDYADLQQINQNTNRAAALVEQLLAYSRKQTLKLQILDIRHCLADLTHLLNRLVEGRISLIFQHDPKLHLIRADRRQLEQVIINLVVNARDAMPEGGDVLIITRNQHLDQSQAAGGRSLPSGDYVCVEVSDQGTGIPAEMIQKIYEPFFSTKRTGEGTGLGLSTAYGIVKQTGGHIFCESTVGSGTTFTLYFPAHIGAVAEDPQPLPVARQPNVLRLRDEQEVTVLLVEDEAPVRAFASRALQLQGYRVLEAACAEDALALLSDQRLDVDVFVTDVVMPGMDGPTWVRTALRDRPMTKVIFMSGYSEEMSLTGQNPVLGSAFLAKPFSLAELTELVAAQLDLDGQAID